MVGSVGTPHFPTSCQSAPKTQNTSLFLLEKRRYSRGSFVPSDFTGASKATSGAQKTQVILGWGAVWPSVCPLMVTNGSHNQLVVIILPKNMQISEPRWAFREHMAPKSSLQSSFCSKTCKHQLFPWKACTLRTLCFGWRVGFVHSKSNRIRGNRPTGMEHDIP